MRTPRPYAVLGGEKIPVLPHGVPTWIPQGNR